MGIRLRRLGFTCFIITSLLAWGQRATPRPLITRPIDETQLTPVRGSTHPLARTQFDIGIAPPDLPMNRMLLVLKRSPQQDFALHKLLDDQQDKASPNYHKWLTPDEFGLQFGPSDQDIQQVTGWLQGHGFQVNRVSRGRTVIEFSGLESQVESALHTQIHRYMVNGEAHWANSTDPQIPAALVPAVAGLRALNDFRPKRFSRLVGEVVRTKSDGQMTPLQPTFTLGGNCGVQNHCYGIGPYDFATIYNSLSSWNAPSPIDGTGLTIAIVGETDINPQDVTDFRNYFGLPAYGQQNGPALNIIHNGPAPGIFQGEETEADLDVQWSGAVAKNASIDFVVSQPTETTSGVDLSALYIVDNNLAPVMSESYGFCELYLGSAGNQFFNSLWAQAAAQGISVMISSGDGGSAGCDDFNQAAPATVGLQVSGFASTPYNTAVGGTDFNDLKNASTYWSSTNAANTQASALGYIPESTWDDNCTNPVFASLGFSTNPESNCNNPTLINNGFVNILSGSGGRSGCINSDGSNPSSCAGGYPKPSWQSAPGVPADGVRDLPDVSLYAAVGSPSGSFYVVCEADAVGGSSCDPNNQFTSFLGIGGTSASAPAFAGIMALVNQQQQARQGNANFVLYKLAQQHPSVFHDVTTGTIAVPCLTGSPNCTTSKAGDQYGILSGYSAAKNYDLATGIGSIDIGLLLQNWATATFRPSVTTLALSPTTNLTHSQSVNVTTSVAPSTGTGTPTGSVSLLTSNGAIAGNFNLSNGMISGSTKLLPGGNYAVTAHYAGDTIFGSSDSSPVQIKVAPETSKTFANLVALDKNGIPSSFTASNTTYGSGYALLRVDVGDSAATVSPATGISSNCSKAMASCPTGTIALTANGSPLAGGSLPLNIEGFAEDQSLVPGTYAVSAIYAGDSSYGPSSSATTFTINKAPTAAIAAISGLPVEYGNFEQIVGAIQTTSNGIAPTGTFTFFTDGAQNGSPVSVYESGPYNPHGSPPYAWADASSTATFLSVGTHTLSVQYSGDTYYASSTSPVATVTVGRAQSFFLGWGASPNPSNWNQSVTLTADLSGSQSGIPPTGSMTFYDNGTAVIGNVTYTPQPPGFSGAVLAANIAYIPTTPGTHNITVTYSGDTNYTSASSPGPASLTVGGPFSIIPSGSVIVATPGQSSSTTLTISSNGGFTGTVTLTCSPDSAAKESTCGFANGASTVSSVQVNVGGTNAAATLNVTTTAQHSIASTKMIVVGGSGGFVLAGFLIFPIAHRRCRNLISSLVFAAIMLLVGCGGGGGTGSGGGGVTDPGTRAGTYNFTVSGSTGTGSALITVSVPVSVLVQ